MTSPQRIHVVVLFGGESAEHDVSCVTAAHVLRAEVRARGVAAYQDGKSHLDHYQRQTGVFYGVLEADLAPRTLLTLGMDAQNNSPEGSTWGGIPLLNAQGDFNRMPRDFNNGARWSHRDQYTRTGFATLEHTFDNGWVAKAQSSSTCAP